MDKVKLYFEEAYDELVNKVSWPSWAELQQFALVVLLSAIIISLIVSLGMDFTSGWAIKKLYQLMR